MEEPEEGPWIDGTGVDADADDRALAAAGVK